MGLFKGNDKNNLLPGSATDDDIYGYGGHDILFGYSGNDMLNGGTDADDMYGGKGNDTYVVDNPEDKVVEYADEGVDSISASISYILFTRAPNVENLTLTGSDDIDGAGTTGDNKIYGNSGNNSLSGGAGNDYLKGGGGNDHLYGGIGDDTMLGGPGSDTYYVDSENDVVKEYADIYVNTADSIRIAGNFSYWLPDHVEHLELDLQSVNTSATGNELNNGIHGSLFDNVLDGGLGNDNMYGKAGNDIYHVDSKYDKVIEKADEGNDTVFSVVDYTLDFGSIETLSLAAGNAVSGTGNAQSNTIFGNAGDNVLNGGGSSDQLSGLGGNDTFVFQAGEAAGDTVYEFVGNGAGAGDVLEFYGYGTAAQGATFIQLTATQWQITSADGLTQEIITLSGAPTIDASDYVFV